MIQKIFSFVILTFCFVTPAVLFAGESDRVKGWAWSPNIGWISMNCTNTDFCETVDYGVTISNDNTTFSGFAWSPNIGWIDFSGASFASASGVISGTASAVAGIVENDGWDGDIVLFDSAPVPYGLEVQLNNEVEGYAWGDTVVGWVSFNCSNTGTCGTVDFFTEVEPFFLNFTANRGLTSIDSVPFDGSVTLSWTTSGAVSCTASGGAGGWTTPATKPAGEPSTAFETILNMQADATFSITCEDTLGRTVSRDLDIFVAPPAPQISITADDLNIPFDSSTTIRWDAQFVQSCTASGAWSGSKAVGTGNSESTGNLTDLENFYNLTCTSVDTATYPDPVFEQVLVNVERLTLEFGFEDDLVPFSDPTTVEWVSTFANNCTASGGAGTTWTSPSSKGIITDFDYSETIYKAGTTEALDPGDYTFTLSCTGSAGQTITRIADLTVRRNPNFSEEIGNDPDPQ